MQSHVAILRASQELLGRKVFLRTPWLEALFRLHIIKCYNSQMDRKPRGILKCIFSQLSSDWFCGIPNFIYWELLIKVMFCNWAVVKSNIFWDLIWQVLLFVNCVDLQTEEEAEMNWRNDKKSLQVPATRNGADLAVCHLIKSSNDGSLFISFLPNASVLLLLCCYFALLDSSLFIWAL